MFKTGQKIRFKDDVDMFPDYFKVKGKTGIVDEISKNPDGTTEHVVVKVDEYIPDLDEWDNYINFSNPDNELDWKFEQHLLYYMERMKETRPTPEKIQTYQFEHPSIEVEAISEIEASQKLQKLLDNRNDCPVYCEGNWDLVGISPPPKEVKTA